MIEQHGLRAHHVADGDDREIEAPGLAGRRIGRGRAGGAHAAADHVRADHEIALGVDRLAGPDHGLPPAALAGDRMLARHVLVAGERVADQHRIGALGIERAVGLVGDLERRELDAGVELERLVGAEIGDGRVARSVRLARRALHAQSSDRPRPSLISAPGAARVPGKALIPVADRLASRRRGLTVNLRYCCQRFLDFGPRPTYQCRHGRNPPRNALAGRPAPGNRPPRRGHAPAS